MAETKEQAQAVKWFRETFPDDHMALCCSQNGGHVGKGQAAARRIAFKKSQGMVVGEADIRILLPRAGFTFFAAEHKGALMTRKLTEDQQAYLDYHNENGACAVSTRGLEALKAAMLAYMQGRWVRSEKGVLYCADKINSINSKRVIAYPEDREAILAHGRELKAATETYIKRRGLNAAEGAIRDFMEAVE